MNASVLMLSALETQPQVHLHFCVLMETKEKQDIQIKFYVDSLWTTCTPYFALSDSILGLRLLLLKSGTRRLSNNQQHQERYPQLPS
jgi:hypothetical protein